MTLAVVDYRLDVQDKERRTALHYDGDSEVPEVLVVDGCVLDVEDKKAETSVQHQSIVDYVHGHG
jgi:hypothetical protein